MEGWILCLSFGRSVAEALIPYSKSMQSKCAHNHQCNKLLSTLNTLSLFGRVLAYSREINFARIGFCLAKRSVKVRAAHAKFRCGHDILTPYFTRPCSVTMICGGLHYLVIIIISNLSNDRSKASSKTIPPHSAI